MKAKDFAILMGLLIVIMISATLFGKCNCNNPHPQEPVTPVDSIAAYYKPALQLLLEQRRKDSIASAQSIHLADSLSQIVARLKKSLGSKKQSLATAEQNKDTPAIVYHQRQVIADQDSVIYEQDQQLTQQSLTIQSQQRTISNYATEVELQKGMINQAFDAVVTIQNKNTDLKNQLEKEHKKLKSEKFWRKFFMVTTAAAVVKSLL